MLWTFIGLHKSILRTSMRQDELVMTDECIGVFRVYNVHAAIGLRVEPPRNVYASQLQK